ncbi:MAG TPA: hypothetical protein VIK84_02315 [Haloplasmataceae bacterium]
MSKLQVLTKELIYDIAQYYYPNSKNPHWEITILEAIDMNERVLNQLSKILDMKAISFIKNLRISQIITILEAKKTIENNNVFQITKKYHLNKLVSYGFTAINIANPTYWIRKLILTSTLETTMRGIAYLILNIVGEEAMKLYSKKIIENSDKILDVELAKFIKEIEHAK